MKQKERHGGPRQTKSLAEIRHQMQYEREEELGRIDMGRAETEEPRSQLRGSDASQRRPAGGDWDDMTIQPSLTSIPNRE